ncbi:hypothetical protein NQ176_g10354 [Zarea fungicola]|uniref:Uncharacterized protein n=1 Tax=Zarea fungicola TaxID=93591 RepID=A0ACC1MH69_9HYPO|nr:hypothetical protein NQ176_g10354 [Lecanicillium fungicola]
MDMSLSALPGAAGVVFAFSLFANYASAIDITLCSSINTAGKYVFAITSHENCWCSNYEPAQDVIVSNSECNFPCLGFPYEFCGGNDLYGYLNLGAKPSGTTDGAPSATPSSSILFILQLLEILVYVSHDEFHTSTAFPRLLITKISSQNPSSDGIARNEFGDVAFQTLYPAQRLFVKPVHRVTMFHYTTTSSTSKATSSAQTVTVDGKVTTVIITPTPSAGDSSQQNKPVPAGGSSLGGGAIAGIVIGAVAGIALIGLLVWFLLRRRKQDNKDEFRDDPSVSGSARGRAGSHHHDLSIAGSSGSPVSAGNRSSMLQVDPRMDPFKQNLYGRSGSAESINTLRDEHDYSRRIQQPKVLRAMNPDPDT